MKFTRFLAKDKSETLSSKICHVVCNDTAKIENVLQNATSVGYCAANFGEIYLKINIDFHFLLGLIGPGFTVRKGGEKLRETGQKS